MLEKDKNVRVITGRTSNQYVFRMNWLIPPFNNVKIRRAAMVALSREEFLQANIGDKHFYKVCKALFTCGTPLASEMDNVLNGNAQKAREMLKEAGYDGMVIVMPQPTDLNVIKQLPIVPGRSLSGRASRSRFRRPTGRPWSTVWSPRRGRHRKAVGTPSPRAGRRSTSSIRR